MRLILYARKSTESEERQIQSIDDQIRLAYEEAARHNFKIVRVISESRSAKAHGKREGFSELLQAIESKEVDGILAWHPDRLARNAVDGAMVIDLLDRGKLVTLHFVSYTFENSPEGKFMLGMIFSQSKYYVDKLSKDVLRGLKSKIAKGWYPHQAPEGYLNDTENHTIVIDPERFPLLRRAWDMMLTGAYTGTQVCAALHQWGYRTRRRGKLLGNNPIGVSGVYKMFDSPFYYGYFRHDGVLYKGAHPPMITEAEFMRVQELLGKVNHIQPKTREYAFTGLIRCLKCKCLITAETKTKHYKKTGRTVSYTYYHCTNGKGGCVKRGVSPELIERQIEGKLETLRIDPAFCTWALENLERISAQEDSPDRVGQANLERVLRDLERKRDGLFEMRMGGEIGADQFQAQQSKLTEQMETAERKLRLLVDRRADEQETVKRYLSLVATSYERFTGGDIRAKREVAVALSDRYFLTLDKLEIELSPLLAKIATFEPVKIGSDKEKSGSAGPGLSTWQGYVENILTCAREQLALEDRDILEKTRQQFADGLR
ncbi:recombinase family protein [Armatimonas sp.]|uniref:recombinase family protein n=1 Tax=Armatimonas sp. TaxID=1872638 RepID=UPI00286B713E|nr:recombinase family protein [Armatimonas sp.]